MKNELIGLGLAACMLASTAVSATELRFTTWSGNERHLEMLNSFADSFTSDKPGVSVRFETIPFKDYVQLITLQMAGDNPPDIGWLLESAAPGFIGADVLLDVNDTLLATEGYNIDDFSKPAMELWQEGEATYGVPFSTSPLMIFYNADAFAKAGVPNPAELAKAGTWTWDTFRISASAVSTENLFGFQPKDGAGYDSRIMQFILPAVVAYGGYAWKDGDCGLDKPEAVEAISQLHSMIFEDKTIVPPGEQNDFFAGEAAMTINQISRTVRLADVDFDWGIAPLPVGPAGRGDTIGQAAIVAFKKGKNQELSAAFLAHITNQMNVTTMAEFFPPIRASVLESDTFLASNKLLEVSEMQMVADAISSGRIHDSHPNYARIMAGAQPKFDALFREGADVLETMTAVCDSIERNL